MEKLNLMKANSMKKLNEDVLVIGDIILTTSDELISEVIRAATNSDISHAMLYVAPYSIIDATGDGVHAKNTQRLFYPEQCAIHVLRLIKPLSKEQLLTITDYIRSKVGTEYSSTDAIRTVLGGKTRFTEKQFCSRLVAQAFAKANIRLVDNIDFCSPQDIKESVLLQPVERAVVTVSSDDMNSMEETVNTNELMTQATNKLLKEVRKLNKNIQNFNDINELIITNPELDPDIAEIYLQSGYLFVWEHEKQKEHLYNRDAFFNAPFTDTEKTRASQKWLEYEWKERLTSQLELYEKYPDRITFRLLRELYQNLIELYQQRTDISRQWIESNS